jgi:hypothetical protein
MGKSYDTQKNRHSAMWGTAVAVGLAWAAALWPVVLWLAG